jgi:hypothetical protein
MDINFWHTSVKYYGLDLLLDIWEWVKGKLTTEVIKNKLLLATDDMGDTVLHVAAECGYVEVLQKLWEWAK